ncbi:MULTISPECIES: phage/plasmid primase, P4 family [unclassified Bradyrhizobium]|uniref:DNA primase family protein n=1 Tax=unclassified Bradyrhizobium TaxID=2631580 RepID=UPI002916F771|nr:MULTISPECIES: phage/plasmid primase, P4 family [unclassified Bradyrhizobium]
MTSSQVLALIDAAPAFAEAQPLTGAALRQAGLAALDAALGDLRGADGNGLERTAIAIGSIVGAEAVNETFAKAAVEAAALEAGLTRELGSKQVKSIIAAGMKLGKRSPREFGHAAFGAEALPHGSADKGAEQLQSQPPQAADRIPSSHDDDAAASDRDDPPAPAARRAAPAAESRFSETSSQMGASPEAVPGRGGQGGGGDADDGEDDDARNMRLAFFPLTDLGNAERFRERYRHRLLWCAALGWLAWDGRRWCRDGADELVKIAEHDAVRMIQEEAKAVRASGRKDAAEPKRGARDYAVKVDRDGNPTLYSEKIAAWGRASESSQRLGALSKRGAPYFAVAIDKLDSDRMKINVRNGTLVVAKSDDGDYVQFKPHDPADLITKLAPVDYDPQAEAPVFDAFLGRIQPLDTMRAFLLQWFGLSLTGDVSEQKLAFFYGKGGNGKSVLIDAVSHVAGDYGETVPIETFLDQGKARNAGQATPDLAILPGVRFLRTSEPEKGAKLAEALIKLATGGEPIQARHLNRDFFKFYPLFKLTMSGNYRPTISGADDGIWRRVRLVPFQVTIPKEERDPHLIDKLRKEASGILNRLLDGLRVWFDKGLQEPEEVVQATAEYRDASDPLGRFIGVCVAASPGDRVQSSVLHEVYEAWCKASGEIAWKNRGLSLAMAERGYKSKQSNVMWWLDIRLVKSVNDFVDNEGKPLRQRSDESEVQRDDGDIEI